MLPEGAVPRFTIITGLSGAGRSEAAKCFEDLGYFVIDNLPPELIDKMAELVSVPGSKFRQVVLVVDARVGEELTTELEKSLKQLQARGIEHRILFLEAADPALVRRFDETRRPHPLAEGERVIDGIAEERRLMQPLRDRADIIVDTTSFNVHELRDKIKLLFSGPEAASAMVVNVISFGYKHGLPLDADFVLDCRFLPNPHWVESLRPLPGNDPKVKNYLMGSPKTVGFLEQVRCLIRVTLPGFVEEGRHYLTIAVGCTGGHHRSVALSEEISGILADEGFHSTVVHRDLEKE
ncbi:MAG: RNase adapter RapZ [Actinomycetota bacterium]